MRRSSFLWKSAQFGAGVSVVLLLSWGITYLSDRRIEQRAPAGWLLLRSLGNLQSVVLQQDTVWAGGVEGLFKLDRRSGALLNPGPGAANLGFVHDLLADRQGILWIARDAGVTKYDGSTWATLDEASGVSPGPVFALLEDREGTIWLGRQDGVLQIRPHSIRSLGKKDGIDMGAVDVLYQDRLDRIWIGSSDPRQGGLAVTESAGFHSFSVADGLVHPSITSVTETRGGTIWVGSGFAGAGGANRLTEHNRFVGMTRKDGLAGDKVRLIYEDRLNRLWFCSEYDGVALFVGGVHQRTLTTTDGLAGQEVKKIVEDADGAYWLATDHGLNKIPSLK